MEDLYKVSVAIDTNQHCDDRRFGIDLGEAVPEITRAPQSLPRIRWWVDSDGRSKPGPDEGDG